MSESAASARALPFAPGSVRRHVGALLVAASGQYLMQLRDDRPEVHLGGHWGLFGGAVEPGEDFAAALLRELAEELAFRPRHYAWFTEIAFSYPDAQVAPGHKTVFAVPLEPGDLERMVQTEGAGRALFDWPRLAAEPRVVPWDACAVLMHARRERLRRS